MGKVLATSICNSIPPSYGRSYALSGHIESGPLMTRAGCKSARNRSALLSNIIPLVGVYI
jgi:hypothetical protein